MARDFMSAARSGEVQVKEEQQRDDAQKEPDNDNAPF